MDEARRLLVAFWSLLVNWRGGLFVLAALAVWSLEVGWGSSRLEQLVQVFRGFDA